MHTQVHLSLSEELALSLSSQCYILYCTYLRLGYGLYSTISTQVLVQCTTVYMVMGMTAAWLGAVSACPAWALARSLCSTVRKYKIRAKGRKLALSENISVRKFPAIQYFVVYLVLEPYAQENKRCQHRRRNMKHELGSWLTADVLRRRFCLCEPALTCTLAPPPPPPPIIYPARKVTGPYGVSPNKAPTGTGRCVHTST